MFKKILNYIIKVVKAPHKEVAKPQGLSWGEIILTFVILSFFIALISIIFGGEIGFFIAIAAAISGIVINFILYAIYLGVILFILKVMSQTVNAKDLTETFLTSIVPIFILTIILALLSPILGSTVKVSLIINLLFALLNAYLFFLGLKGRFLIPQQKSAIVAGVLVVLLMILPIYMYKKAGEVSGTMESIEQSVEELQKQMEEMTPSE